MNGPLLRSGDLADFQALGAVGIPLYTVAAPVRAAIRKLVSPQLADMLAIPQVNERGSRIDWYAPFPGSITPLTQAAPDERVTALQEWEAARARLSQAITAAEAQGRVVDHIRQFRFAADIPDPDFLYLVDGRPVLTFWGFAPQAAPKPMPLTAPEPIAPPAQTMAPTPRPPRRLRPWMALPLLALLPLAWCGNDITCTANGGHATPPELVVLLDTSNSMSLPMSVSSERTRDILKRAATGDVAAGAELMEMISHAGPASERRIGVAKAAIGDMLDGLPSSVRTGVVLFGNCEGPQTLGISRDGSDRPPLIRALQGVQPTGGTPLAKGLEAAAALVGGTDKPASIALVSDGEESCRGDPCAVARALKLDKPKLTINVVDVTGDGAANCVAELTGGRVLSPATAKDFKTALSEAAGGSCR